MGQSILGSIKDTQNEWVLGATVKLHRLPDSSFVQGTVSNESGKFSLIKITSGQYFLKITSLSYKEYKGVNITLNDQNPSITLPTIFLLPAKEMALNEVTVKARKPLMEEQIDRTVVNLEAMIAAPSLNSHEVLERTPGVQIDANGNITLNGKQGVLVLIDGRPTYMSGNDLAAYLKSLPGVVLEKLELMDNPPAKYEAAGGAIINIILKKNRTLGFTGNLALGASLGKFPRSNNSLNVNYKKGKINLFSNLTYNYDKQFSAQSFERKLYDDKSTLKTTFIGENYAQYSLNSYNSRLGIDINTSEKTVFGFQFFLQNRPLKEWQTFENQSVGLVNNNFFGENYQINRWNSNGLNFNLNHKINDKGHELSADLNYINYGSTQSKEFETNYTDVKLQNFDNEIVGNINIYNFKADYVLPLAKGSRFDAGIKTSFVNNDNDAQFFINQNDTSSEDFSRSNHFIYNENLNAAYVNFQKPINKTLNLQLGLRAENTNLLGELMPNSAIKGERFTQNFTNIFPSVFVNYKLGKDNKHGLGLNYSKRINRPNYQQFNPFLNYVDTYTYTQGNTEATPFFLDNYRLQYTYGQVYRANFGYTTAEGILGDISIRQGDVFIRKPFNVGTGFQFMLAQNLSLKPTKFWNTNLNFNVARFEINGKADGAVGKAKFWAANMNVSNQFSFKKRLVS